MSSPRFPEPRARHQVSPELVLVDPELAALARVTLPDPVELPRVTRTASPAAPVPPALRAPAPIAPNTPSGPPGFRRRRFSEARVLVGVAAALVMLLLFADVRVEVGKNGAAAESVGESGTNAADAKPEPGAQTRSAAPRRITRPHSTGKSGSKTHKPRSARGMKSESPEPRQLAWAPVPGAGAYHVELYRGSSRIFTADTVRPAVLVPARWTEDGAVHRLEPGTLRWYVWPVMDGARSTAAIVQATLTITPS